MSEKTTIPDMSKEDRYKQFLSEYEALCTKYGVAVACDGYEESPCLVLPEEEFVMEGEYFDDKGHPEIWLAQHIEHLRGTK
jgi:hypothetical protein